MTLSVLVLVSPASAAGLTTDLSITLEKGAHRVRKGEAIQRDLLVAAACRDGKFAEELFGYAIDFAKAYHDGKVTSGTVADDGSIRLALDMGLRLESWEVESTPKYVVALRPAPGPAGGYEGTYEAELNGGKWSGKATARAAMPVAGRQMVEPGERPRLLFRKQDLPKLREAAKTPAGQAIVARLRALADEPAVDNAGRSAAAHAILYALDGHPRSAESARVLYKYAIEHEKSSRVWTRTAATSMPLLIAFDLASDQWPQEFRRRAILDLRRRGYEMMQFGDTYNQYEHAASAAFQPVARGVGGIASLALLGDAVPEAELDLPALKTIEPPPNYWPGKGVPILTFGDDAMLTEWVVAGPFPRDKGADFGTPTRENPPDPLADVGGRTNPAPPIGIGTQLTVRDVSRTFQKMPREAIHHHPRDGAASVNLNAFAGRQTDTTWYMFTTVEVDQRRGAKLWGVSNSMMSVWVGGQRCKNDQPVRLHPGRVPILVEFSITEGQKDWAHTTIRFKEAGYDGLEGYAKWIESDLKRTTSAVDEGGPNRYHRLARLVVERFVDEAAGGNPENYARGLNEGVLPFALAHRNVTGFEFLPEDHPLRGRLPASPVNVEEMTRAQDLCFALLALSAPAPTR